MKANRILSAITLFTIMFVLSTKKVSAGTLDDVEASGNQRAVQIYSSTSDIANDPLYGPEYAMRNLVLIYKDEPEPTQIVIDAYVANGMKPEYRKIVEDAGITINAAPSAASKEEKAEQVPIEYTVEDVTPYPAWATKDCNIRSGADTSYDKAGSLKKDEQVTVTGKTSTGWFRINTSGGKEAYILSKLITTENPSSAADQTEKGKENGAEAAEEGDNVEAASEVTLDNEAESAKPAGPHEHTYTSEVTKEATCTEPGILTYMCECGDTFTEEIPLADHTEGEWELAKDATLISNGARVRKCTVCGEVLEKEIIHARTLDLIKLVIGVILMLVVGIPATKKYLAIRRVKREKAKADKEFWL